MHEWPVIHDERCHARTVKFTDRHAMIHLADTRVLGVPLCWFPPIKRASAEQRQNYISYGSSVYWHDIDDGIDLIAMLTAMYIVPVFQRESRNEPHIPTTRLYLDGGARRYGEIEGVPFVHDARNIPQDLRCTDERLEVELADGRVLCLPWRFCPSLARASGSQLQDYQRNSLTIAWEALGVSIDLIAMLTGFYDLEAPALETASESFSATAT